VNHRILVVDDDLSMCELLGDDLGKSGFDVVTRRSAAAALEFLRTDDVAAIVTDLNMRGMNGLELCERIAANRPDVPVVVITAFGSLETAIRAIRVGAYDFITKPFEMDALILALERAVRHRALHEEVKRLRRTVEERRRFDELLGASDAIEEIYDLLDRLVDSDAAVLITGESGTGKEVVAHALHRRGRRSAGPFMAINCAAMPEQLLESELFGHTRGAFTDARTARTGLFVEANGGTLFLDEIGDLPLALQPKLLRALQERVARPVGGTDEIPFDVRLVASTNRDLETAVDEGRFREDLFFRINVVQVPLPPLRARGGDVLLLAQHFVDHYAARAEKLVTGLSAPVAERFVSYTWPGNVRELQNCIERAVALARFEQIVVDDLPERIRAYRGSHVVVAADDPSELAPLEQVERRYILRVMEAVGGNKTVAARVLGLDRTTLYRKLERFNRGI
jgi:two-component system response regulator HydG